MILSYTDLLDKKRKTHRIKATITTDHPASSYTQPIIVLENGGNSTSFPDRTQISCGQGNQKGICCSRRNGFIVTLSPMPHNEGDVFLPD